MAKQTSIKPKKERASKYEEKVTFQGTFQDMLNISLTGAGAKKTKNKATKSS
jgi:hypothetical protein